MAEPQDQQAADWPGAVDRSPRLWQPPAPTIHPLQPKDSHCCALRAWGWHQAPPACGGLAPASSCLWGLARASSCLLSRAQEQPGWIRGGAGVWPRWHCLRDLSLWPPPRPPSSLALPKAGCCSMTAGSKDHTKGSLQRGQRLLQARPGQGSSFAPYVLCGSGEGHSRCAGAGHPRETGQGGLGSRDTPVIWLQPPRARGSPHLKLGGVVGRTGSAAQGKGVGAGRPQVGGWGPLEGNPAQDFGNHTLEEAAGVRARILSIIPVERPQRQETAEGAGSEEGWGEGRRPRSPGC